MNNPVKQERADNRRFLHDVEKWIGRKIEIAINDKYPNCDAEEVWIDRQYISGPKGAPCTVELKKEARYQFEIKNKIDWHVLGFTADEQVRFDRFVKGERANTLPVLIDAGMTKQDCYDLLIAKGIEPPDAYKLGYPNANCEGCVKASSPEYWNHVRLISPDVFKDRAELSRKIGARLVRYNGKRIFLDELPENAKGRPLKQMTLECGIFCDTE